jgi:hypothetical protein
MTHASTLYQTLPFPAKGIDCKAASLDWVPIFYRRNEHKRTDLEGFASVSQVLGHLIGWFVAGDLI